MEPFERLRRARKEAGYESAVDAARAFGWNEATYRSHENGIRGLLREPAERYARAFHKPVEWLLFGKGDGQAQLEETGRTVRLVGYVGAGAEAHFYAISQGDMDEVTAPADATPQTVAVEIRGDSLGRMLDRWLVFYDQVESPVTTELVGKICVVGLPDDRVLIKRIRPGSKRGLFRLESEREPPIEDVTIDWAAQVKAIRPR